jgi:DNA-binding CsgD family transcriptional regulator
MEPFDIARARVTYLEALCAALVAAGFTTDGDAVDVAKAARSAPGTPDPEDGADLLLSGMTALILDGEAVAAPALRRALNAFAVGEVSLQAQIRWGWLACRVAPLLWDDAIWPVVAGRAALVARVAGSIPAIAAVTPSAIAMHVLAGEMVAAEALAEDALLTAQSSGMPPVPYGLVVVAGWLGREPDAAELIDASVGGLMQRGEGMGLALLHWARALLHNSHGRYRQALAEAEAAVKYPPGMLYSRWGLIELIEAAARCGNVRQGAAALSRLAESTQASGTDWALGIEARSRSLLSSDDVAEAWYREAITRLGCTRIRAETARAHLLFGEWLRRQRRRTEAREHLRTAAEMFESMDAAAFADRARVELLATGEHARKRKELPGTGLSAQEFRIAVMASDGMSDTEIASQLFISASTVDYHLRKVFRKLGVKSRARLHLVLPQRSAPTAGMTTRFLDPGDSARP